MKKMKMILAAALALLMMLAVTGCGASNLLLGSWSDSTEQMQLEFDKDGNVMVTMYGIPLPATYEYEGDTLTIHYSETISQSGTLTFFGDDEFCWENTDTDGSVYQDYYTRAQ